jgi:anti-sigma regulatory factor (Ser/Thr protein kinase)
MTAPLDFTALDGLAFAAERGRLANGVPRLAAHELGPLIEMALLARGGLLPAPETAKWLQLDGLGALYSAIKRGHRRWICPSARRIGFLRMEGRPPTDETIWTGFGLAAQQAAAAAGFPARIAAQLAAALGELHSNVYEHSGAPATGLVAFLAAPDRFEFVVSDRGFGVLESLRSCTDYAGLTDHGEALRLTLTDGVSRHGANAGRGFGFRPLFIGLANLNGALRFRSGDHALVIDGINPSLMTARTAQKPSLKGLMISVACERRPS